MAPRRIDPHALPQDSLFARKLRAAAPSSDAMPVTLEHDGDRVTAHEGELLAIALLAAGHTTLARSPKYHRPRGPSCLRGACDGCLVRVDGVPNVMSCRVPVREGMRVLSQNAFPSAAVDLLGVTDWFFPGHMDHHHLMVGFGPAVNRTMQVFARRMAGMGTLPDDPGAPIPAEYLTADVLVVGAGSAGSAAASALAAEGLDVLCVDDEGRPGGARLDDPADTGATELHAGVRFLPRSSAVATFDNGTVVQRAGGLAVVTARARLFANGCHDLVGAFLQNDLPGIFTARAFARALCAAVLLGRRVAVVGDAAPATAAAEAARAAGAVVTQVPDGTVREATGSRAVKGAVVTRADGSTVKLACDALVIAGVAAAAYELAGQAGAALGWDDARGCFAPAADEDGATSAEGVYVAGSLRQGAAPVAARTADGVRVAARIARDLREGGR